MINLFSGTPGSGKSLYATYYLIRELKTGRGVIANFAINEDFFKKPVNFLYRDNSELTVPFLVQYSKDNHIPNKEHQTTVIIDEAGVKFNVRDWDVKDRIQWIKFFTLHRKLGYDFILISQFDKMLSVSIRALICLSSILSNCEIRIKSYPNFLCRVKNFIH